MSSILHFFKALRAMGTTSVRGPFGNSQARPGWFNVDCHFRSIKGTVEVQIVSPRATTRSSQALDQAVADASKPLLKNAAAWV
jgi:hypothetical protein